MWEGLSKQHPTLRRRPDTADVPGERISSGLPAAQRPAQTTPANLEQQLTPALPCSSSSGQLLDGGHRGSSHDGGSAPKHRRGDKAKLLHMITPERSAGHISTLTQTQAQISLDAVQQCHLHGEASSTCLGRCWFQA